MTGTRRVGVVLGAGGTLGAAWMVGMLGALQEHVARPLSDVEFMQGTSAGSILAAALRSGSDVAELVEHQRGGAPSLPPLHHIDRGSPVPPPRLRPGSPALLARAALAPHRVHPRVAAASLVPEGRRRLDPLGHLVTTFQSRAGHRAWPSRPTWIVAVDYHTGHRAVFGRPGSPEVSLADAVVASCSIPGWYEPKTIGGRRYVDGGVHSTASADLAAGAAVDHLYVLAPMAGHADVPPRGALARGERFLRRCLGGWLDGEVARVEAAGTKVTVVTPGPADLAAMGINLMDATRRRHVLETALTHAPRRIAAAGRRVGVPT